MSTMSDWNWNTSEEKKQLAQAIKDGLIPDLIQASDVWWICPYLHATEKRLFVGYFRQTDCFPSKSKRGALTIFTCNTN